MSLLTPPLSETAAVECCQDFFGIDTGSLSESMMVKDDAAIITFSQGCCGIYRIATIFFKPFITYHCYFFPVVHYIQVF